MIGRSPIEISVESIKNEKIITWMTLLILTNLLHAFAILFLLPNNIVSDLPYLIFQFNNIELVYLGGLFLFIDLIANFILFYKISESSRDTFYLIIFGFFVLSGIARIKYVLYSIDFLSNTSDFEIFQMGIILSFSSALFGLCLIKSAKLASYNATEGILSIYSKTQIFISMTALAVIISIFIGFVFPSFVFLLIATTFGFIIFYLSLVKYSIFPIITPLIFYMWRKQLVDLIQSVDKNTDLFP